MEELKLNDNFVVTMHHDLVQARFADSLTMNEQKILYAVLSNIEPPEFILNDKGEKVIKEPVKKIEPFRVPIKAFTEWLGFKDPNYVAFKNTVRKLMRKLIEIRQSDGSWELFQWVTKSSYIADEGMAEIKISPELYPYLLNLDKNFTTVKLHVLLSFKSVYSPRLYSLMRKWLKIGSWKVELDELKHLIGVPSVENNGVREFKLARYNHFKKRALEVAVSEINDNSELDISFKEIKKGRKITSITFFIKEKKKGQSRKKTSKSKKANNDIYAKDFLDKYFYDGNQKMYRDRKTNNTILFDGRDRIKAIILQENLTSKLDNSSLFVIEDVLSDIVDIHEFDIVKNIQFIFRYTEQVKTINNPSAFIISTLNKLKNEVLNGNCNIEVKDIIKVRDFRFEETPDWFYKGFHSKFIAEKEEEIKNTIDKLDGTHLTISDIKFIEIREKMEQYENLENLSEKDLIDYQEYKRLKNKGDLEERITLKKNELIEKGFWNEKEDELKKDIVDIILKSEKELVNS